MVHQQAETDPSRLIDEHCGYPYVTDGEALLSSERGIEELYNHLIGFDEFDASLVLKDMKESGITSFMLRPDRFISNQVPEEEKANPWEGTIELAQIAGEPILAHLGGGYQFITGQTTVEEIKERGDRYREAVTELKQYREVDLQVALSSEKLQRILERDYGLKLEDLQRIQGALDCNIFVATTVPYNLDQAITHVVNSRDKLNKPVIMKFGSNLLIGDFGVTEQDLDGRMKAQWKSAREQAELREELAFEAFDELDHSDPKSLISWMIGLSEKEVSFLGERAEYIQEKLSNYGYDGETPERFWDYYYSEDERKIKGILLSLSDDDFDTLLINITISNFGSGGCDFIMPLTEYRSSLTSDE